MMCVDAGRYGVTTVIIPFESLRIPSQKVTTVHTCLHVNPFSTANIKLSYRKST